MGFRNHAIPKLNSEISIEENMRQNPKGKRRTEYMKHATRKGGCCGNEGNSRIGQEDREGNGEKKSTKK